MKTTLTDREQRLLRALLDRITAATRAASSGTDNIPLSSFNQAMTLLRADLEGVAKAALGEDA